jgi:hypothetical protein
MIANLIFLLAALKLHDVLDKPLQPALLFTIPTFIFALLFGAAFLPLLLYSGIGFAIAYGYFFLLSRFPFGASYYTIAAVGGVVLVFVI